VAADPQACRDQIGRKKAVVEYEQNSTLKFHERLSLAEKRISSFFGILAVSFDAREDTFGKEFKK